MFLFNAVAVVLAGLGLLAAHEARCGSLHASPTRPCGSEERGAPLPARGVPSAAAVPCAACLSLVLSKEADFPQAAAGTGGTERKEASWRSCPGK